VSTDQERAEIVNEVGASTPRPTSTGAEGAARRFLRKERAFSRLLGASFVSGVGDQFNRVAVVSLIILSTGSTMAVAASLVLRIAMQLLFGPVGALIADRFPRKPILLACDFGRAAIALVFLVTIDGRHMWLLYSAVALLEIFSALFTPARSATVPTIVSDDNITRANALDQSGSGLVMALGSLAGGVIVAGLGTTSAFLVNSISFAISGLLIASIRIPRLRRERLNRIGTRLRDVWPLVRRSRQLTLVLVLFASWPLAGGALSVLIPAYASRTFHDGESIGIGALYGALGAGYLIGGLVAVRLAARIEPRAAWVGALSFVTEGFFYALTAVAPGLIWACVCMMLATTAAGLGNAAETTIVMRSAPAEALGRIFGLTLTISSLSQITAMLVAGFVLTIWDPRPVGAAAGAVLVLLGLGVTAGLAMTRSVRSRSADKSQ
jgi:MFS family permease